MKINDTGKPANHREFLGLVVVGIGSTAAAVLPSEAGAFCRPTEMCAPPPMSTGDEPAGHSVPQLFKARTGIGSSVSVSSLSSSSVSFRT
jgi:hypothetical protein